jgi:hypothetical protein
MSISKPHDQEGGPDDGTCIIWAVIVLVYLDAKLPSDAEVAELLIVSNERSALRMRNAFTDLAESCADRADSISWEFPDHDFAHTLLLELARTGSNYFQDTDPEFLQLCAVLEDFSSKLHAAEYPATPAPLTPRGIRQAVRC